MGGDAGREEPLGPDGVFPPRNRPAVAQRPSLSGPRPSPTPVAFSRLFEVIARKDTRGP